MSDSTKLTLKNKWFDNTFPDYPCYKVPINWVLESYTIRKGVMLFGKGKRKIWLGFCVATDRLVKMQPNDQLGFMTALVVRDTYIEVTKDKTPIDCEEKTRCLNIDCPLNHTTKESYFLGTRTSEIRAREMRKINWDAITSYRKLGWSTMAPK